LFDRDAYYDCCKASATVLQSLCKRVRDAFYTPIEGISYCRGSHLLLYKVPSLLGKAMLSFMDGKHYNEVEKVEAGGGISINIHLPIYIYILLFYNN
jgi:hypothetical protein